MRRRRTRRRTRSTSISHEHARRRCQKAEPAASSRPARLPERRVNEPERRGRSSARHPSPAETGSLAFWRCQRPLAGLNDGGVDEDVAKSALSRQRREDPMPRAGARPALKKLVRAVPRAELRREITSRTLPMRAIHSTASTNKRLSVALHPGSSTLPGGRSSIRRHCASASCFRIAPPTRATGWGFTVNPNVHRP